MKQALIVIAALFAVLSSAAKVDRAQFRSYLKTHGEAAYNNMKAAPNEVAKRQARAKWQAYLTAYRSAKNASPKQLIDIYTRLQTAGLMGDHIADSHSNEKSVSRRLPGVPDDAVHFEGSW